MKYRQWITTHALELSAPCLLVVGLGALGGCGSAGEHPAPDTRARSVAQADLAAALSASSTNQLLGAIANAYGSYQAAAFLFGLLPGGGGGPSLADVESTIVSLIRNDRDDDLAGTVDGLLNSMIEIGQTPNLSPSDSRLGDWLTQADVVEAQITLTLNRGNVDDAHQLAAALNTIVPIHVNALQFSINANQQRATGILTSLLQTDFQLVGSWSTSRTVPLLTGLPERNGSVLWLADSQILGTCARQGPECTALASRPANRRFNGNHLINVIESSMMRLIGMGISSVNAADGTAITVIDPIGRESGLALTGGSSWEMMPVAFSNGDGSFVPVAPFEGTQFPGWAATPGVQAVAGDFDGDGWTDIGLTGASGWSTVPVAFSFGNGGFRPVDKGLDGVDGFPLWASTPGAVAVAGDFDRDGRADIALTGGGGWGSVPVAFSNGDGSFRVANVYLSSDFPVWASTPGARPLAGDFDGDGRADIALTGVSGWGSVPVAFSNGDGSFRVANVYLSGDFPVWASTPGVQPLVGDFDGDGKADVALTGGSGWSSIPLAFSNGDGTFHVVNNMDLGTVFPGWASTPGARAVVGDFDGDGRADIALTGVPGWESVPVAFSNGDGTFRVMNQAFSEFPDWASESGVTPLAGIFR